jgi:Tol biopolymer transport system component
MQVESSRSRICPESDARITQLSSAAFIHTHIYPEAPVFTPDSRYFIYHRFQSLDSPSSFWLCDLQTNRLRRLTDDGPVKSPVMSPDGAWCAYLYLKGPKEFEVRRVSLQDGDDVMVTRVQGLRRPYGLGTISPDGRWYVTGVWLPDGGFGLLRIDLGDGTHKVIHQDPEILNPHMQFEPKGQDILVQHNRGGYLDEEGNIVRLVGEQGATIYLVDCEGQNVRRLPIGKPYTAPTQGHQCWVGTTGRILSTTADDAEAGNLFTVAAGDERPTPVARGTYFCHPNVSRDGRWFVSDVSPGGEIVVGSLETGRYRLLCESESSFGRPQYTHPHPFFSPDARHVLFNSDRTGLTQIYAAEVPEGFLEALAE